MIPIPKYNRHVFIEAIHCSAPDREHYFLRQFYSAFSNLKKSETIFL